MIHLHRATWAAVFVAAAIGCGSSEPEHEMEVRRNWAIAIHGGAGHFGEEDLTAEQQAAYTASLSAALAREKRCFSKVGTALRPWRRSFGSWGRFALQCRARGGFHR